MKYYFIITLLFITITSCTEAVIEDDELVVTTDSVYYNPEVQLIMQDYCVSCHSGTSPSANLPLDNYADVRHYAEFENLIDRMNDIQNPMPPEGVCSSTYLTQMDQWVILGFPESE